MGGGSTVISSNFQRERAIRQQRKESARLSRDKSFDETIAREKKRLQNVQVEYHRSKYHCARYHCSKNHCAKFHFSKLKLPLFKVPPCKVPPFKVPLFKVSLCKVPLFKYKAPNCTKTKTLAS